MQNISILAIFACLKGRKTAILGVFKAKMKGAARKELHPIIYIRMCGYSKRIDPRTMESDRISVLGNSKGG